MRHFIFDLDGTLTESRKSLSLTVLDKLHALKLNNDIVVISGAEKERIIKQLNGFEPTYILAQSGADCPFWQNKLSDTEEAEVLRHFAEIKKVIRAPWQGNDFLQHRGCQMTLSFAGHHAPLKVKLIFDPTGSKRTVILKTVPFKSGTLEARIAGTTCIDYTHKNYTKGKSIARLIEHLDWDKEECVYFGDKLFKGGNDETVIGTIKTVAVVSPEDLLIKLKKYA